ncbi:MULTISPECIES: ATP-binding cassette domain-containing protein [unclassified Vibrio]|uniref:ATP-binding cassette domain-containing protein n=1 Tax=Vibrio sp. HB236076 TaxID=3232307 RepID=A0AB39H7P6_9VIBR|nr:ATP-binding cassette domain-containing protein [Vibrio sp. HB161653]MDP5253470.1 ATP-binding cassette domain-containing protein [Vibrio sp. HB161653]
MITVNQLGLAPRLEPLDFSLPLGKVLHVIGPNGCGKSTLLKLLSGELTASSQGKVLINAPSSAYLDVNKAPSASSERALSLLDVTVKEQARYRAYLSQQSMPSFAVPVYHYLHLSCPSNASRAKCEEAMNQVVEALSLADKLGQAVTQLSGGEWQRVRLAGSALQVWPSLNPDACLWLLDEPAAPLDVAHANQCHQLIQSMADQGIGVIVANHDLNRALYQGHWVLMLKQGKLQALGASEQQMTAPALSALYDTEVVRITHEQQAYLLYPAQKTEPS